jgi:WD40 repeat protein
VKQFKEHTKYAHRTAWSLDGRYFATCGHDKAVAIYRKEEDGDGMAYALHRKQEFVNLPEAMCFLDDGATLVVSLGSRKDDTNCIHHKSENRLKIVNRQL